MEDPALARQLDPLFHLTSEQYSSIVAAQNANYDLLSSLESLKQKEIQKMPASYCIGGNSTVSNSHGAAAGFAASSSSDHHHGQLGLEQRPPKTFKPNSWDSALSHQQIHHQAITAGSAQSMIMTSASFHSQPPGNNNRSFDMQRQQQHQQRQQVHMSQDQQQCMMSQNSLDGGVMSVPYSMQEEVVGAQVRTTAASDHVDMRGSSPASGVQESCNTDVFSLEGLSRLSPLSPTESIRGCKRKPEQQLQQLGGPMEHSKMHHGGMAPTATVKVPLAPAVAPSVTKNSGHTQDHIMAERKRREKLSQRFIALSAVVPGLKKVNISLGRSCKKSTFVSTHVSSTVPFCCWWELQFTSGLYAHHHWEQLGNLCCTSLGDHKGLGF